MAIYSYNCPISKCYIEQIAKNTENPKASRAIGLSNNRNPICVIIPHHRIIGDNGKHTGYRSGLDIKEHLLKLEGAL